MSAAYVIAGASLAGAKAAETLREEGYDGPLILIGEETERPYERLLVTPPACARRRIRRCALPAPGR